MNECECITLRRHFTSIDAVSVLNCCFAIILYDELVVLCCAIVVSAVSSWLGAAQYMERQQNKTIL